MPYYYYGFDPTYFLVIIGAVICMIASARVKSTYNKYSQYRSASGMTGAQAAQRILNSAGIYDVTIQHVSGNLTDHYNPSAKTLNLSDSVYNSTSVAAVGVAAHECGHAIQHQNSYFPLTLRTAIVPAANLGSTCMAIDSDRIILYKKYRGSSDQSWNHLLLFCSDIPACDIAGRV